MIFTDTRRFTNAERYEMWREARDRYAMNGKRDTGEGVYAPANPPALTQNRNGRSGSVSCGSLPRRSSHSDFPRANTPARSLPAGAAHTATLQSPPASAGLFFRAGDFPSLDSARTADRRPPLRRSAPFRYGASAAAVRTGIGGTFSAFDHWLHGTIVGVLIGCAFYTWIKFS